MQAPSQPPTPSLPCPGPQQGIPSTGSWHPDAQRPELVPHVTFLGPLVQPLTRTQFSFFPPGGDIETYGGDQAGKTGSWLWLRRWMEMQPDWHLIEKNVSIMGL